MTKKRAKKRTVKKTAKKTSKKKKIVREPKSVEQLVVHNFVGLQKVLVELTKEFKGLSGNISKMLMLFENTSRAFTSKFGLEHHVNNFEMGEKDREFLERLDLLLEQNKNISKGLEMMDKKLKEKLKKKPGDTTQTKKEIGSESMDDFINESLEKHEEIKKPKPSVEEHEEMSTDEVEGDIGGFKHSIKDMEVESEEKIEPPVSMFKSEIEKPKTQEAFFKKVEPVKPVESKGKAPGIFMVKKEDKNPVHEGV